MALRNGRARIVFHVGVELVGHRRLARIPDAMQDAALGCWLRAGATSRAEELDGFCPGHIVERHACAEVIEKLIEVGLFVRTTREDDEGYRVVRYEEWNETKAEIDKRLRKDRTRKKRSTLPGGFHLESKGFRSESVGNGGRSGDGDGDGEGAGAGEDLDLVEDDPDLTGGAGSQSPAPVVTVPRVRTTDDGASGMAVTSWLDGIRSVMQTPAGCRPNQWELEAIASAIRGYAPEGQDAVAWAARAGAAFARAKRGGSAGLSGDNFAVWMRSGGHVPTAPKPRPVASVKPDAPGGERTSTPPADLASLLRAHTLRSDTFATDLDRITGTG